MSKAQAPPIRSSMVIRVGTAAYWDARTALLFTSLARDFSLLAIAFHCMLIACVV